MIWKGLTVARRGLLAILVATLGLAVQPVPAAAPATGTLYGGTAAFPGAFVSVDPTSGAETTIATVPGGATLGPLVADPSTNQVFADASTCVCGAKGGYVLDQIAVINPATGAIHLTPFLADELSGLAMDSASGKLLALDDVSSAIVSVDPSSGVETPLASIGLQFVPGYVSMAENGAAHKLYMVLGTFNPLTLVTFDTSTDAVSSGPLLGQELFTIAFDSSAGVLVGVTVGTSPSELVRVDPLSGTETPIATYASGFFPTMLAIDPVTHTSYAGGYDNGVFRIVAVNDATGALSAGGPATALGSLAFRSATVTPASLRIDVENAYAAGYITSADLEKSLLSKIAAAMTATSQDHCSLANSYYQAFINQLTEQSGKLVTTATANTLIAEARTLIVVCR